MKFMLPTARRRTRYDTSGQLPQVLLDCMQRATQVVCATLGDVHPFELLGNSKIQRIARGKAVWTAVVRKCCLQKIVEGSARGWVSFDAPSNGWCPVSYPVLGALIGCTHGTLVLQRQRVERDEELRAIVDEVVDVLRADAGEVTRCKAEDSES